MSKSQHYPKLKFASMASAGRHATATPSTGPHESLRVSRMNRDSFATVSVPRRFDGATPEVAKFPGDWQKSLGAFDRLILLRALRPDRCSNALASWIGEVMGKVPTQRLQ